MAAIEKVRHKRRRASKSDAPCYCKKEGDERGRRIFRVEEPKKLVGEGVEGSYAKARTFLYVTSCSREGA